ncbi:MAG: hypothetical protein GX556_13275 [Fibrobacter sp.]|nr:hypothetical protein [Fibrobacter sp.]
MKLKLKDIIAIAVVTVISFPVLYILLMFLTGVAHIEFEQKKETPQEDRKVEFMKQTARKDSLAELNSRTFQALQKERAQIENDRARLIEQQQRIDMMQREMESQYKLLQGERTKLENLVSRSDSLDDKKVRQLSKVYAAMRPAEAAQILETLQDDLAVKLLDAMNDDRQKAKIISALSTEKASRITRMMGL